MITKRPWTRAVTVLVLAGLGATLFAMAPAAAVKAFTKKKALKLFYTKAQSDSRFTNIGEKATSAIIADNAANADKLDNVDSTGFLKTTDTAANADKLDNVDSTGFLDSGDAVVVQADQDSSGSSTTETDAGMVEVNSVSITVPSSGALVISGTTLVNNTETVAKDYQINAEVNGTGVSPVGWTGYTILAAEAAGAAEVVTFSYTVPHPITAGTYTVTQEVGPFTGTADFVHNNEELTVMFVPGGTVG